MMRLVNETVQLLRAPTPEDQKYKDFVTDVAGVRKALGQVRTIPAGTNV